MGLLSEQTDRELLEAFVKKGCERSFTVVVHRYAALVHGVAARTLDGSGQREDVGQLTFLQLAKKASRLLGHDHLAGWLHRTAYQQALNLNRGQRRAQAKHLRHQEEMTMSLDSENHAIWQELSPVLDQELQKLSAKERDILTKRFFAECSVKELAAHAGISRAAAEKRLQRSLAKLRDRLGSKRSGLTTSSLAAALLLGGAKSSDGAHLAAGNWAVQALKVSPKSVSLLTTLVSFLIVKKTLSVLIVLLFLSLLWSQSPWSPFSSESKGEVGKIPSSDQVEEITQRAGSRANVGDSTAARISGRVVDKVTGEPLVGARVFFQPKGFQNPNSAFEKAEDIGRSITKSNGEGYYLIKIPDASRAIKFSMQVFCKGYCQSFTKIETDCEGHVPNERTVTDGGWGLQSGLIRTGENQTVDFHMAKAFPIRGIVSDQNGNPISKVDVQVWYNGENSGGTVGSAKTDKKGHFEVIDIPESISSGRIELEFEHPDFAPQTKEGIHEMTIGERSAIKVTLSGRHSIEGIVFDSEKQPLPGAKIRLSSRKASWDEEKDFIGFSDSEGKFLIKLIHPGEYEIHTICFKTLEQFDGEVTIHGAGEMDLQLKPFAGKKEQNFECFGLSLIPLSPEQTATFYGGKTGGLYVTAFQKTKKLKHGLKPGVLIYGVVDFEHPYRDNPETVRDFPEFIQSLLKHAKRFDDGTATVKIEYSLRDKHGSSTNTFRFSAEDLIWLKEKAGQ